MWLALTLMTALSTSLKDVFGKKIVNKIDPEIVAFGWLFFTVPYFLLFTCLEGVPQVDGKFWICVFFVTIILTIASILFFKAIKTSDLSISVPMLTFSPVFLLVTSPIMLGEFPKLLGLIGILMIVIGAYVTNFTQRKNGILAPLKDLLKQKGPRYMLCVAALYSIGANIDKMVVVKYSMHAYLLAVNGSVSVILFLIILKKSKNVFAQIKTGFPFLFLMGTCTTIAFLCQMNAIQMTIVPYVIAIKRTSVVMSALFGFLIFKEKGFKERISGVILMVIGVFIISFYG